MIKNIYAHIILPIFSKTHIITTINYKKHKMFFLWF